MKIKIYFFLLILLLLVSVSYAQKTTLDSLKAAYTNAKTDTDRINILNLLSAENLNNNANDQAKENAENSIAQAQKANFKKGEANGYLQLGLALKNQGKNEDALKDLLTAQNMYKNIASNKDYAIATDQIGDTYFRLSNYHEALNNCLEALKIATQIQDKKITAHTYNNIGTIYDGLSNYPEALKNYFEAVKINDAIGDDMGASSTYNNIGIVYDYLDSNNLALKYYQLATQRAQKAQDKQGLSNAAHNIGIIYQKLKNDTLALQYFYEALQIRIAIGYKEGIAHSYNSIGVVYFDRGNFPKALENYFAALRIKQEIGDIKGTIISYDNIGSLYFSLKKYTQARQYTDSAIIRSKTIASKECLRDTYGCMHDIDSATGNWKLAYEDHKLYVIYRDSIDNQDSRNQIIQIKKQADNYQQSLIDAGKEKTQQQLLYKFIIGFLVVLLVVAVMVNRLRSNLKHIATNMQDAPEIVVKKMSIVIISIATCFAALVWAWLYYHYFGLKIPTFGPIIYFLLVAPALLLFFIFKKEKLLVNIQLFCIFTMPLMMEWTGGGFQSGVVINWCILAPIGALMYKGIKAAAWWMILFVAAVICTIVFNDYFGTFYTAVSNEGQSLFYGMNIIGPSIVIYFSMQFFVRSVIRDGIMLQESNKKISATLHDLHLEKQKSDNLLLNILPEEVAEELKNKGSADAKFFDDVTVLFTDFKGFTTVAERLTPQQLVNELDACFKAFDGIMGKYGIEKIKTVGDAYLAVCGLPVANQHHATNVVNAALEIRAFMQERKTQLGILTFDIRIGVHSGSVVAGIVGIKKFAYDIWGDTVNTAARMEQNSEAGKINISASTYQLVNHQFTCTYRGQIVAKNKGALAMYFVENI